MKAIAFLAVILFCLLFYSYVYSLTRPEFFDIIKPATLIQYTSFFLFALIVNKLVEDYKTWFRENKTTLIMISFFVFMAFAYEVVWTFFYWFSNYNFYGIGTDIDEITYLPIEGRISYPYNLNVNSKMFWLGAFCSLYLLLRIIMIPKVGYVI